MAYDPLGELPGSDAGSFPPVMTVGSLPSVWTPQVAASIEILIPGEHSALTAVYRTADGRRRQSFVRAPMVAVFPPDEACRVHSQRPAEALVLSIAPDFFAQRALAALGAEAPPRLQAHYAALDPFLREVGNALRDELCSGRPLKPAYLMPLAGVIAVHLARRYCGAASNAALSGGLPQHKLTRVLSYVDSHIGESLHVSALAAEAHLSPFHFARMFKRTTGQPPHLYVVMQRIERAKALLRDGELPLIDVAQQAGFRTQGHFSGVFRRYTGSTPRAFRLNCRALQAA